jgi:hypothetical protein
MYMTPGSRAGRKRGGASGGGGASAPTTPQGRLTLTSATAVTTSDVAGAATIYYTPSAGLGVPLYNGATTGMVSIGAELSLALDSNSGHTGYHQSGKIFDLVIALNGATPVLGTSPAWTNDTTRADALAFKNGFLTNSSSMVVRFGSGSGDTLTVAANQALYVGSFRATANGQASDTITKRLLFNAFNQVDRPMSLTDTVNTFAYSSATYQQFNASTANQFEILDGLGGGVAEVFSLGMAISSAATLRQIYSGVGIDSSTVNSAQTIEVAVCENTRYANARSQYRGAPGLGYHTLRWIHRGGGGDTQTWAGTNSGVNAYRPGLIGSVWA